jgi:hypothetical protein
MLFKLIIYDNDMSESIKKYPLAPVPSARNNIEWNYIVLPCNTCLQNGILCITQNIPTEKELT